jgi:hypothetical protein
VAWAVTGLYFCNPAADDDGIGSAVEGGAVAVQPRGATGQSFSGGLCRVVVALIML